MGCITKVNLPPAKPLLVYDGECRFCVFWVRRWQHLTQDRIDYLPFQDPSVSARFPESPVLWQGDAVYFIEPNGEVYRGAAAIFRTLASIPGRGWPLRIYQQTSGAAWLAERCYQFIASHRAAFSKVTRFLWGHTPEPPSNLLTRWLFLRSLGVVYSVAFLSLWLQLMGLVGSQGLLPVEPFLNVVQVQLDQRDIGWDRYRLLPTVCWLSASDPFLHTLGAAGLVLSVLVIFNIAPALSLFLLWAIYLSLITVGREFLSFQWDSLLLETTVVALLLAPGQFRPGLAPDRPPSLLGLWLARWLLFRLMFESGCVKLLSGDAAWRELTALAVHFETQPLPTWTAWYAHQLPSFILQGITALVLVVEVVIPFFILAPRRMRLWAGAILAAYQLVIIATGNHAFLNFLTLGLIVLLLDDLAWRRLCPARWRTRWTGPTPTRRPQDTPENSRHRIRARRRQQWLIAPVAAMILIISGMQVVMMLAGRVPWPAPLIAWYDWVAPLRSVNHYGLFSVMTQVRREIVLEGSHDGQTWREYQFKYKPGDLKRAPAFVAPFQPRLDWQMWFAALGTYRQNPWFVNCCVRLLQGSPTVLPLLEHNPFPQKPPQYLRARLYDYRFTDWETHRKEKTWWRRTLIGEYSPVLSLQELELPRPLQPPPGDLVRLTRPTNMRQLQRLLDLASRSHIPFHTLILDNNP